MPKAKRVSRRWIGPKAEVVDNDTDDSLSTPPQSNDNNISNDGSEGDQNLRNFYRFLLERVENQANTYKDVAFTKLLALPRLREFQLRPNWPYNFSFKNKSNISAALIQTKGELLQGEERCAKCKAGRGIFPLCVVLEGVSKGACGCCSYSNGSSSCSFRKSQVDLVANRATQPASAAALNFGVPTPAAITASTPAAFCASGPSSSIPRAPNTVKANPEINPTFCRIGERMSMRVNERQYLHSISRSQTDCKKTSNTTSNAGSGSHRVGRSSGLPANTTAVSVAKMEAMGISDNDVSTPGGTVAGDVQANVTKVYMRLASAIQDMKRQHAKQMAEIDSSMAVLRKLAQEK